MDTWARATPEDREALFNRTSATKGISSEIIEKDFWVCWMLQYVDGDKASSTWRRRRRRRGGGRRRRRRRRARRRRAARRRRRHPG